MAMDIVDDLEIVEIDEHDRETVFLPFCPLDLVSHIIPEGFLVVEVRQRVASGKLLRLSGKGLHAFQHNDRKESDEPGEHKQKPGDHSVRRGTIVSDCHQADCNEHQGSAQKH